MKLSLLSSFDNTHTAIDWSDLHIDIIHIIIKFTGKVIYRNGKYIDIGRIIHYNKYHYLNVYIEKRKYIIESMHIKKIVDNEKDLSFFIELTFNPQQHITHGMSYNWQFVNRNVYEVCYYKFSDTDRSQTRMILT